MLCIIIPFFNEEDNIKPLVENIEKVIHVNNLIFDIITINDGSTDGTLSELKKISKKYQNIKIVSYEKNKGIGGALKEGIKFANEKYATVLFMDGDMSHDPVYIPNFLEKIEEHDFVVGSRYIPGGGMENVSLFRQLISRIGNALMRVILNVSLHDITSGYRMINTTTLRQIALQKNDFMIQVEMVAKIPGDNMAEIPIVLKNRKMGKSKFRGSLKTLMSYLVFALKLRVMQ